MTWNLFSLVLTSATSWAVLAIGFLPVAVLRQQGRQPLAAAGAWALVAATAPVAAYHWYLIFALICLVAWTKLDRPAGKVILAIAASLGLSLGIVFPLELMPELLARENPFALASLYLGGAATGVAYAVCVVARTPDAARQPAAFARALVIAAVAWMAVLGAGLFRERYPLLLPLQGESMSVIGLANPWVPLLPAIVLVILAFLVFAASRRNALKKTRGLAGIAAVLAFVTSLLAQL